MIRTVTLAALAATLASAAAAAEPSIRISTAGKSPEQLHREVVKAANSLCFKASREVFLPLEVQSDCVRKTVRATYTRMAQTQSTKLAQR